MKSVLIVEDDSKISKALEIRLGAHGYHVRKAADAAFAMSEIDHGVPDIVVLDINLPDGSGFAVAERMKSNPETSETPVIFITASKKPGVREQAQRLLPLAYIEKPFSSLELVEALAYAA